jgi:hypothetical protein
MPNIHHERGVALLVTLFLVVIMGIMGGGIYLMVFTEAHVAEAQQVNLEALSLAQAGIERAFFDLRKDFENGGMSPSWADGSINGIGWGPNTGSFSRLSYSGTTLGSGSYEVAFKNVSGATDAIWVRAVGTVGLANAGIETYVGITDLCIWNNAIFAAGSAGKNAIRGNVDVRGSVHILGEGLVAADFALNLGGCATIGNNYFGMPAALLAKIPACPQKMFGGELVESLEATLRVKRGRVELDGTSSVGFPDVAGNAFKETMDGVYVTDGYGGNKGASAVSSDNGSATPYDMGDRVTFPRLTDPYAGYSSYIDYLKATGYVITEQSKLNTLADIKPNMTAFTYADPMGKGSISMSGTNLTINGIIVVSGPLAFNKNGNAKTITYTGKGSILALGDVGVTCSLITAGNNSYPTNILGVMTPSNVLFDEASIDVMGIFYAEGTATCAKQTDVVGAFASRICDMGTNVPSIFYVPAIIDNLPPGLIGSGRTWALNPLAWHRFYGDLVTAVTP